jgi:hypothetical protein
MEDMLLKKPDRPAGTERSPAYTFSTLTVVHQALLPAKML